MAAAVPPINIPITQPIPRAQARHSVSLCAKRIAKLVFAVILSSVFFVVTPLGAPFYTIGFLIGIVRADSVHSELQKISNIWKKYRITASVITVCAVVLAWHWILPISGALYAMHLGSTLDRHQRGL